MIGRALCEMGNSSLEATLLSGDGLTELGTHVMVC